MASDPNESDREDRDHGVRLSIGVKVFGVACGLVLLMVASAAISTWYVDRIGDELEALASGYLPLERRLAEIDVAVLEQEILLQRIPLLLLRPGDDPRDVEEAIAAFDALGQSIEEEEEEARRLLAQVIESDVSVRAKMQLSRFDERLVRIGDEHQDFEDHAHELIEHLQAGRYDEAAKALEVRVQLEEDEYDATVTALRRDIDDFVTDVAQQTRNDELRARWLNLMVSGIAALFGLSFAALVTAGMVRPVRRLLRAVRRVEKGRLDTHVDVSTNDEIGLLTHGFNEMVGELRIKERIKDTFGKYVDPRIVGDLIDQPELSRPGGERRVMTVMFSDIRDFSGFSERLTPGDLVAVLNEYLSQMSRQIRNENGVIDKFIGDAIMAYWGPPFVPADEQAARACRAALAKLETLGAVAARIPEVLGVRSGAPEIDIRIGIATGPMIVGTVGSEESMNFTVLGDTVNLGSRLEGACKAYGIRTLVDEQTRDLAGDAVVVREIDLLRVKGRDDPERVFELLGRADQVDPEDGRVRRFEAGLAAYRRRDWDTAVEAFEACRALETGGGPSTTFLERISIFRDQPPPETWDGVWTLTAK